MSPARGRATGPGVLRVASYNLRGLRDDVAAAREVVRRVDPDVLLLQELPRGPGADRRVAAFAAATGMTWSGRTRAVAGTGLMSAPRVRARASSDRRLPVRPGGNPRGYTVGEVTVPGGRSLAVVSLHLPLLPELRVLHARRVLAELAADAHLSGLPWVLGGDLNEQADGAAWGALAQVLPVATPSGATFPTGDPRRRIDAIYVAPSLQVLAHREVALERAMVTAATDHAPVWVDLRP